MLENHCRIVRTLRQRYVVSAISGNFAVHSRLNRNSFSHFRAILVNRNKSESQSQKIDDLPALATFWSDTLAILSSEVNGLVGHGSTR